jgi:hypothetical protein
MPKRRNCSFNGDLQKEFTFIKLNKLCSDGTKVVCQYCNVHSSFFHGGRRDMKNISSFMPRRDGDSESNKFATNEAHVTYTVRHGQTFRANDCLSALI